ncbi:MAG: 4-(cytidine 5'-diphospho)-2-C-methyl-D-erythritol kinase [Terriglobales bacterium]
MPVTARSYAKINIGLAIGKRRDNGFHDLLTVYQSIAAYDTIKVAFGKGTGIEIKCRDPRVPADETNTCHRVADRVLKKLKQRGKLTITIEKNLPVKGGLGAGSSNAVATMIALEKELKLQLSPADRLNIAAEVGSDLPLFLVGGTVLGIGRGEQVFPLEDLPAMQCVLVFPKRPVSTPEAFRDWDEKHGDPHDERHPSKLSKLTQSTGSDTINPFSRAVFSWLMGTSTGVPAASGDRAETLLLDLVRAGIENDFERVVFPKHPELRDVKRVLEREGARYASLSGSGSALYGLFSSAEVAAKAAAKLNEDGVPAQATSTLTREQYWKNLVIG